MKKKMMKMKMINRVEDKVNHKKVTSQNTSQIAYFRNMLNTKFCVYFRCMKILRKAKNLKTMMKSSQTFPIVQQQKRLLNADKSF